MFASASSALWGLSSLQVLVNGVANAINFTQTEDKAIVSAKVLSRAEFEVSRSVSKVPENGGGADPGSGSGL